MPKITTITAFGEAKTIEEWAEDPRCTHGKYPLISDRVFKQGWETERAITQPARAYGQTIRAFGKAMSTTAWAKTAACVVSLTTLNRRIREGWDHEEALTTPAPRGGETPTNLETLGQQQEAIASIKEHWQDWEPFLPPPPPEKTLAELVREVAADKDD